MEELDALSQTCQLNVKGQITQNREQFDHKYYVGKGKIDEIKSFIEFHDIDVVVTNDELTTAQSKTLNDNLGIKIIDRTINFRDIRVASESERKATSRTCTTRLFVTKTTWSW